MGAREYWLTAVAFAIALLAVPVWLHFDAPHAPVWVSVRLAFNAPGFAFHSVKLERAYPTRRACEHAIPSSGLETIGARTVRREWYCVKVGIKR